MSGIIRLRDALGTSRFLDYEVDPDYWTEPEEAGEDVETLKKELGEAETLDLNNRDEKISIYVISSPLEKVTYVGVLGDAKKLVKNIEQLNIAFASQNVGEMIFRNAYLEASKSSNNRSREGIARMVQGQETPARLKRTPRIDPAAPPR